MAISPRIVVRSTGTVLLVCEGTIAIEMSPQACVGAPVREFLHQHLWPGGKLCSRSPRTGTGGPGLLNLEARHATILQPGGSPVATGPPPGNPRMYGVTIRGRRRWGSRRQRLG